MKKINKIKIQNTIAFLKYKNKTLKVNNKIINGNLIIENENFILKIENYQIKLFQSSIYKLNKKLKIINYDDKLKCINSLKNDLLDKKYHWYMILLSVIFNFKLFITYLTNYSIDCISYLNQNPFGLKQNTLLKVYFTTFFIIVFKLHLKIIQFFPRLPYKCYLLHLNICHNVISKIYFITFMTLYDTINIFRGRNYNKMKKRVDKIIYPPDVIILSSFIFVFSVLIIYTIIGFYIFSLIYRIIDLLLEFLLNFTFILLTTNFKGTGVRIINKKIINEISFVEYKMKETKFCDKFVFSCKVSAKKCNINMEFLKKIFTGDYQIKLK